MEDGSNGPISDVEVSDAAKNGVLIPIMAKFPDGTVADSNDEKVSPIESTKINGDYGKHITENNLFDNDSYGSESDALVIDESIPKKQKATKKKSKSKNAKEHAEDDQSAKKDLISSEVVTHSNPYFNESLFELSQLHQNSQDDSSAIEKPVNNESKSEKSSKLKVRKGKGKPKPKLREYAQYLGLQPAVQFKCSKCGRAGFDTLGTLQEHIIQCNAESVEDTAPENSGSSFKLTRKVFLCSACGTYYENWNLYMHMLEFHRRFICLYCLGMFSVLDDLCQHIQTRHNHEPGHKDSLDEFFNVYDEPCYVVCCECNKLFSEQDNFFYHNCSKSNLKGKKPTKAQITPENHVTGETETVEEPSNLDKKVEDINTLDSSDQGTEGQQTNCFAMETSDNIEGLKQLPNTEEMHAEIPENTVGDNSKQDTEEIPTTDLVNSDKAEETNLKDSNNTSTDTSGKDQQLNSSSECEKLQESLPMDETSMDSVIETRKVPKLSLRLPKPGDYQEPAEDSDDSEKLTMEVDQVESENDNDNVGNEGNEEVNSLGNLAQEAGLLETGEDEEVAANKDIKIDQYQFQVAGSDVPTLHLELEQPLDKFDCRVLLQKCLKTTIPNCIYCNHARKIAVNGKQLALHCIAEHRFSAIVNSITAEELIPDNFVNRLMESLDELEESFFNLESSFSDEAVTFSHLFECFQCYFSTTVHKELYLHNRKFHSKNLLLCIMCKSNFYSYSELICHLCPGLYILDYDLQFRCCMCVNDDLPSSFRLMVHLRKKHNVCDVCLEMCHNQYRLSSHVWKHKLHHFCYRCGIAYRNKPDITRHLFWKHGTESVLCKKCLQKKWPHVYHFCVPPASFACDECGLTFTKAVSLNVHKRIHTEEKKHVCTFEGCQESFISKKLMLKHERRHFEPMEEVGQEEETERVQEDVKEKEEEDNQPEPPKEEEKFEEKPKPKIDVLDLPALNLSESDSSDSEPETTTTTRPEPSPERGCDKAPATEQRAQTENSASFSEPADQNKPAEGSLEASADDPDSSSSVIQNIWDNFKNYQASKEKLDNLLVEPEEEQEKAVEEERQEEPNEEFLTAQVVMMDHDYCIDLETKTDSSIVEVKPALTQSESIDHDYCTSKAEASCSDKPDPAPDQSEPAEEQPAQKKKEEPKKKKKEDSSSSSSSGTDSSSCSCGSNCSCSSSSGSSSSSSDSSNSDSSTEEGRKKQLARRQRRKERARKMKEGAQKVENKKVVNVIATSDLPPLLVETPIKESDLETTESETDEEFYDRAPQKLAKKVLEEKRQQLLAIMGPNSVPNGSFIESTSRPPTPPAGVVEEVEEEERRKKKSKSKKRKKRKSERAKEVAQAASSSSIITPDVPIPPYYQQFHQQQLQQPTTVAPITLSLARNSPVSTQSTPLTPILAPSYPKVQIEPTFTRQDLTDTSLRASKRRRVPNRFYGYSSDEEQEKAANAPMAKWRKTEMAPYTPRSPLTVPPITIKTTPLPIPPPVAPPPQVVEPISIRTGTHLSDFRVQRPRPRIQPTTAVPPTKLLQGHSGGGGGGSGEVGRDSATESNDSSSEERAVSPPPPKPAQPQLYCYCRCPYDEVSEMIGCDASDCAIEWFHFECVGIMVPPKGQWFCPDCRKKKQQRRELLLQQQQQSLGSQQGI